jgi:cation diffusion facilitator family transporter
MIRTTQQAALGSIAVGVLVFCMKLSAWALTGSVAFYSDALESVVNIVAAVAALVAVRVAARPADANHPFGHQKAEFLSATLEAALILVAAGLILWEAFGALMNPRAPDAPLLGALIVAAATAINAVWATLLLRWARLWASPALKADGRHLFADVVSSAGVLAGPGAVPLFKVMVPAVVRSTMAPLPPVVRTSLWTASVLEAVALVASLATRLTLRPTSSTLKASASST